MRRCRIGFALVVVAVWAILISARVSEWQDGIVLWGSAVRHAPARARPQANFALALARQGFPLQAITAFDRLVALSGDTEDIEVALIARRNGIRLRVQQKDLDAWFQGDPNADLWLSLVGR